VEIRRFFVDRIFSKGLWQSLSPDVTPPDVVLCGTAEGRVFEKKPRNADDQKTNIINETAVISYAMLGATLGDMESRVSLCLREEKPFSASPITQLPPYLPRYVFAKFCFHW
jgi:hypothetical protein